MTLTKNLLTLGLSFVICCSQLGAQQPAGKMDRTVLPIQEPKRPTYNELDARNATAPIVLVGLTAPPVGRSEPSMM